MKAIRLLVHVEGETEETFVNEVLAPHLLSCGYERVSARLLGNSRKRVNRGGIKDWPTVRLEIRNHLLEDRGAIATTMVDYYALPKTWPGRDTLEQSTEGKAASVQGALATDFQDFVKGSLYINRFVPFVMMHEFEGLLFSDCSAFCRGIYQPNLQSLLQEIRDKFSTPEDINDSPETAPSKRILKHIPSYEKPLLGTLGIVEIGLETIRLQCPNFNEWIGRIEGMV